MRTHIEIGAPETRLFFYVSPLFDEGLVFCFQGKESGTVETRIESVYNPSAT